MWKNYEYLLMIILCGCWKDVIEYQPLIDLIETTIVDLNLALDSKRHRKPWVVRSVGGQTADFSPAASVDRSRRLYQHQHQQQPRVFSAFESSNKGGVFINVSNSGSRREGANILCKS